MKVLLAIDDSPYSRHLMDIVCGRHWPAGTEFKIIHVLEPLCLGNGDNADRAGVLEEIEGVRWEYAEKLCTGVARRLQSHVRDCTSSCVIMRGDAKNAILDVAAHWQPDRIMVGAHGRDVCPHNLLGSVSRAVAAHAPCAVEVVRIKPRLKHETDKRCQCGELVHS